MALVRASRLDQAEQDGVDAHALRREFGGQRAHQVLRPGPRRRRGHHVRLGLQCQQRVDADDGRVAAALTRAHQLRQEGADRMDQREEFQVQLFAPGLVAGVGEGRNAALAGVVDQHVGATEACAHLLGETAHLRRIEHVGVDRQHTFAAVHLAQRSVGGGQPCGIAATDGD
jgi:hypothetical protein